MKGVADRAGMDVAALGEGEQRAVQQELAERQLPAFEVLAQALSHPRPEGHEAGFGELHVPNDKEIAIEVDVFEA